MVYYVNDQKGGGGGDGGRGDLEDYSILKMYLYTFINSILFYLLINTTEFSLKYHVFL